jgi:hypothetical protein
MDDQMRQTLRTIEVYVKTISLDARGKALVAIVRDHVDDDNMMEARRVLKSIPQDYFSDYMYAQAVEDKMFGEAVARLIEVLGYGFWLLAREAASA